jgi:chemotaxis protein MotB
MSGEPQPQEIIIVRRGGGDDLTAPKGGSWKIAYADFVTAMMAFFLVMWLINSANEATRAKVASYFNPIKMTDTTPSGRGLKESVEGKPVAGQKEKPVAASDTKEAAIEAKLVADPQAALAEIEREAKETGKTFVPDISSDVTGDPFDPQAWQALRNGELRPTIEETKPQDAEHAPDEDKLTDAIREQLQSLVTEHRSELDVFLTVDKTQDGLVIKLGDNSGVGMFAVGSAKPQASLIKLVGLIGKLLSEQKGDVIVSGHTDRRPYKVGSKDNWQLSSARAHIAGHMLLRGGLPAQRIRKLEGYGDAVPLIANDPLADANRRVEFLLVEAKP